MSLSNFFFIVISCFLFFVSSLSGTEWPTIVSKGSCEGTLGQKDCIDFVLSGHFLENISNPEQAIQKLGKPNLDKSKKVKNVIYRSLSFEGLEIGFASETKSVVTNISITQPSYRLKHGFKLQMTKQEIVDLMGPGWEKGKNYISYNAGDSDNLVTFYFKNNRVIKIVWTPYSG